ncbi:MAG: 4'-phosphopantetheinyl transferase superfamily protein [Bacteroidia bacterium]|nr:4'-phosphopantetheinyl transferase superfamily protein [Bacteroidia bacterium]
MPLVLKKDIHNNSVLGIWKMTEDIHELFFISRISEEEKKIVNGFTLEKRKKEWLCTRVLANELSGTAILINYDDQEKPHISGKNRHISISHSKDMVAVIIGKNSDVGIDIEFISDRVEKIKHKFLSKTELCSLSKEYRLEHMLVHWCAKEALLKIYGKKNLDFIGQLIVTPFEYKEKGSFYAALQTSSLYKKYKINYFKVENYMVVWCGG